MTNVAPNTRWGHGYDGFHSQAPRDHDAGKPTTSTEGSNLDAHWMARCHPSAHAVEFSKTAAHLPWRGLLHKPALQRDRQGVSQTGRASIALRGGPMKGAPVEGAGTSAARSIDRSAG